MNTTLPDALKGTGDQGYVTGLQAAQTEFDQIVTGRLPVIIAVVIAVAFLLIITAFRSLTLAVKAAVLNLFSIGAAYGIVVAVFQFGWGRGLLGVSENVPVEAWPPASSSTRPSSGSSWSRRSCTCSAPPPGGCRNGSAGSCPASMSKAHPSRPRPQDRITAPGRPEQAPASRERATT